MNFAPCITNTTSMPGVSENYQHVNTMDIITNLMDAGYDVTHQSSARYRDANKAPFVKHLVRMRNKHDMVVGDIVPEIVIVNSHNRSAALKIMLGFYRLVCANGLVIGNDLDRTSWHHTKKAIPSMEDVMQHINRIRSFSDKVQDHIEAMRVQTLNKLDQEMFAHRAYYEVLGRTPHEMDDPQILIQSNRVQDSEPSVWNVFNRVQENAMKGQYQIMGKKKYRKARAIRSVDTNINVNQKLFDLALEYVS